MLILILLSFVGAALAAERAKPPVRDPHTPGFVEATELPDGEVPPVDANGNFIIGPTHTPSPLMKQRPGVPEGKIFKLTMESRDSKIYPGIAREKGTYGTADPNDPSKMIVTTSGPAPYTRSVTVYVPQQYKPGTEAPFIVGADGPDRMLFAALDNLIHEKKVPAMIAISIGNGSGDAQGSQRGLEYDTMSGLYAEFVESEVLPLVERECQVKLTKDPDGRATMGCSSGGSCALIMAWYRPDLYHRVLTYSGTYVNQQWPHDPETPHGAWGFHEKIIAESPVKPLRIWLEISDQDLLNPNAMLDGMHDWVVANERMAQVLAEKGYEYQFVFARNAFHCDAGVKQQTLPAALEWLWQGFTAKRGK
ncbi:MAG: enterobactin esterase [Pirellulales bacterium]|nr:enterobactin esterase [Pirellulales bacterium]